MCTNRNITGCGPILVATANVHVVHLSCLQTIRLLVNVMLVSDTTHTCTLQPFTISQPKENKDLIVQVAKLSDKVTVSTLYTCV